jgi:hypothetical protein
MRNRALALCVAAGMIVSLAPLQGWAKSKWGYALGGAAVGGLATHAIDKRRAAQDVAAAPAPAAHSQYCKDFGKVTLSDGREVTAYGSACLTSNGDWRVQ